MAAENQKEAPSRSDREACKRLRAAQDIQHRLTALEAEVRLGGCDPQNP